MAISKIIEEINLILKYNLNPINKLVLDSFKSGQNKPEQLSYNNKPITYKLEGDKLEISYNGNNYIIETKPYIFYDENKNELGTIYSYMAFNQIMSSLFNKCDIYNFNDILLKDQQDILNNLERTFILKEKNIFTYEKFNSLNSKRNFNSNDIKPIEIPKKELSPIPFEEFNFESEKINLILENRIYLIQYINNFMENWIQKVLIIYGCNGIGKSSTFIYLSNLYNDYKVLYFNLKLIMTKEEERYDIFVFEIMRYYTVDENESQNNNINNKKYEEYLKQIKNINKIKFNFWAELKKFVESQRLKRKTLLILDQYKDEFDKNNAGLEYLENLMLNDICTFKLLISFSVNNSSTKNKLIKELKHCSYNSSIKGFYPKKTEFKEEDNLEEIFDNLDLKKIIYDKNQDDGQFPNIELFRDYNKGNENNKKEAKEDNSNETNKGNLPIEKKNKEEIPYNKNIITIIYINQLISVKEILDNKIRKYFDIFDYNPKYYIKFLKLMPEYQYQKIDLDNLFKIFLDNIYNKISKKLFKYYKEFTGPVPLMNDPIIELIKLKDLVDNKATFTALLLKEYVMEFPVKYIKIKKVIDKNNIKDGENIINLNKQFNDTEFYFEYCFPFFESIISKIIYMNEGFHWINFEKLSGSAKGSFIEQKIKRNIIYEKIFSETVQLRYVWDFYSPIKEISKTINQIDYENFEKIDYDENRENFLLPFSHYYIVPGSQKNWNIDSALLISDNNSNDRKYILITFQIKQGVDLGIKKKYIFINSYFTAKNKLEKSC